MPAQMVSEGRIAVTGGQVWYRCAGSGGGIPLLVLHGGPGLDSDYLSPLEALGGERPVIRYDQLGGGRSDRPEDARLWTVERFVDELAQVRAALRLSRVHLFGHSWGSTVAAAYALNHPAGLASLVLAAPWLSVPRARADIARLRTALPADVQQVLEEHERAGTTDSDEYQRAVLEFYRRHICRLEGFVDAIWCWLDAGGRMPPVYQIMNGPSELAITGTLRDYDCTGRLRELRLPTLLTCGRYDEVSPAATEWYASLIPGSETTVFEHSAHMPHLEETEAYLDVLRGFLRRAESPEVQSRRGSA